MIDLFDVSRDALMCALVLRTERLGIARQARGERRAGEYGLQV